MSLLAALLLAAVEADGATTWLSTFTGSARADYAVGPSTVSGTAEILPEGAIRFAADSWLEVRGGPGVLPRDAGTVEFRLRPEWDAPPAGAVPILRYGDAAIAVEPDGRLRATGFAGPDAESLPREWARGEWFLIAVSWGPAGLVVLVDGAEAARGEGPSSVKGEADHVRFGGGACAVDDLRISDTPRRPAPSRPIAATRGPPSPSRWPRRTARDASGTST